MSDHCLELNVSRRMAMKRVASMQDSGMESIPELWKPRPVVGTSSLGIETI